MDDEALVLDVIARHPLASLVTHDGASPEVDLIPLLAQRTASGIELVGHVARANGVWQVGRHEGESLAVFRATDHYISPTWYPSKAEHHRTVPTWNYVAVHAWGPLEVHDDPRWVRAGMAPPGYVDEMLAHVVGIRIPVRRVTGKFKVSAHKSDPDRLGARDGVAADPGPGPGAGSNPDLLVEWMSRPPGGTSRAGAPAARRAPR
ncbi:MAG: FMN-binding negative transcriptional regulator [Kytococcus sp.]|nr:FMN-binding negative transcriptional regulator [Kytococcus sp.]